MIAVTERAKQELKKILLAKVDHPLACLRLTSTGPEHLGLGVDIEGPGDEVVEYEGSTLLLVDQGLASRLKGVTLDVEDTPEGPELVICGAL